MAEASGKEISWSRTLRERKNLEHGRNPRSHSQCQGGSHAREWRRIRFVFPDGSVKLAGRNHVFRTSAFFQITLHEARSSQGESDGLQPLDPKWMTSKPELISGVFSGNHIYHHAEPSVHFLRASRGVNPNITQMY